MAEDSTNEASAQSLERKAASKSAKLWAKIRGWLIIAFIIGFAILSGTVLRKPLAQCAGWLHGQGIGGYFLVGTLGWVFLMIGGSANFLDLSCGFIYGNIKGFIVAYTVKLVSVICSYLAGRYLFRDFLLRYFFEEYVWLGAVALVIQEKPWPSNLLIRLSVVPAAIKSYGLGSIESPPVPFFTCALLVMALLSWILTDLGSKANDPSAIFKKKNKSSQILEIIGLAAGVLLVILEIIGLAACVLLVVGGAWNGRKYINQVKKMKVMHEQEEKEAAAAAAAGAEGEENATEMMKHKAVDPEGTDIRHSVGA